MSLSRQNRTFSLLAIAAVVIAIAVGFWLLGSPAKRRQIRTDQQRLNDLKAIAMELRSLSASGLPAALSDDVRRKDPISGQPYEYRRIDKTHYELCATFTTDSSEDRLQPVASGKDHRWQHPSGQHCYQLDTRENPIGPQFD